MGTSEQSKAPTSFHVIKQWDAVYVFMFRQFNYMPYVTSCGHAGTSFYLFY